MKITRRQVGTVTEDQRARMLVSDPRVPVIRCTSCNRLRMHPKSDDPRTLYCGCGGMSFYGSMPHDDELQLAMKLYAREIEENNIYGLIAQDIIKDYRNEISFAPGDRTEPKIIIALR